ncbi:MAG TPA: hypothetical protein VIK38_00800 [Coriobacteriia bacterium]
MSVITGGKIIEGGGPEWLSGAAAPVAGTNEAQTITVTATAGTFQIGYDGWLTTALAYDANSAAVQAALRLLPSINGANVTVANDAPHLVTFVTGLGKLDVPLLTTVETLLETAVPGVAGTAAVTVTTPGVTATGRGSAKGTKYTDTANGIEYVNTSATALAPTWVAVSVASIAQELLDVIAAIPVAAIPNLTAADPGAMGAADAVAVAGLAPAGGAGATAGAYDTAEHRDAFIATVAEAKVTINALVTLANELKAKQAVNRTELIELKADHDDLLTKLRTAGIVTP